VDQGATALYHAAKNGRTEAVGVLLAHPDIQVNLPMEETGMPP
jgi:hypothetical protein